MCKYCDFNSKDGVELLYEFSTEDGTLIDGVCILRPTPISVRKNPERPATLQFNEISIPIAYCPVCGRKLNYE